MTLGPWHSVQAISPFVTWNYTREWERELTNDLADGGGVGKYEDMAGKMGSGKYLLQ